VTEEEWLSSTDLTRMMPFIEPRVTERKIMLFGCACCRRQWPLIPDGSCKNAVDAAERFADGVYGSRMGPARDQVEREYSESLFWYSNYHLHTAAASYFAAYDMLKVGEFEEFDFVQFSGVPARELVLLRGPIGPSGPLTFFKLYGVARRIASAVSRQTLNPQAEFRREEAAQSGVLRDIFGNPFRPLPPRPEAIAPLAEQIYAGAWDQMPILGEWLQEHGYWSEGEHCLDPSIHHVKGCWVVDWVTGRE
jgi:hypothetical protein